MWEQGNRLGRDARLGNISLLRGDAAALPWLEAQFDRVVCRITLHQVDDPAAVRAEIRRRLDDEPAGGEPTGLRPARDGGHRTFMHLPSTTAIPSMPLISASVPMMPTSDCTCA